MRIGSLEQVNAERARSEMRSVRGRERSHVVSVPAMFDGTAGEYDHLEKLMSCGSGPWYRRSALLRAGLSRGMKVLDVAVGTGLVAREAAKIVGAADLVVGVDPSWAMVREAMASVGILALQGRAEALPIADESFDFVAMGFALRHVSELPRVFGEFRRVLRPGGKVCVFDMAAPESWPARLAMQWHIKVMVPMLTRLAARDRKAGNLWRSYWETSDGNVSPSSVMEAMRAAELSDVKRHVEIGLFSEFTGLIYRRDAEARRI